MTSAIDVLGEMGALLRQAREARGMSLQDVSNASQGAFGASVLGAYERNERTPNYDRIVLLARIYEVVPGDLYPPANRERWRLAINAARTILFARQLDANEDDTDDILRLVWQVDDKLREAANLCGTYLTADEDEDDLAVA